MKWETGIYLFIYTPPCLRERHWRTSAQSLSRLILEQEAEKHPGGQRHQFHRESSFSLRAAELRADRLRNTPQDELWGGGYTNHHRLSFRYTNIPYKQKAKGSLAKSQNLRRTGLFSKSTRDTLSGEFTGNSIQEAEHRCEWMHILSSVLLSLHIHR